MCKRLFRLLPLVALLAICTGCPRNANNTVTVVIDGDPALVSQIAELLAPSLLDDANWSYISWSQWGWGKPKLTLAPVVNPEELRERIRFGTVTRIDQRTVYVKADRFRGTILVVFTRIKKMLNELLGDNDGTDLWSQLLPTDQGP
jgi:hypothetical protein